MASSTPFNRRKDPNMTTTSSTSSSSTPSSTSTTMFYVSKNMPQTTTSEDDESSCHKVTCNSTSDVQIDFVQSVPQAGPMYGQQPPPGFNFYMPMGPTVPVVFTGHGIQIPGFNAPVSASSTPATCWVPDAVTEEESSSSTIPNAEQVEDKIAVAGVFKILPEGTYLPTFVQMQGDTAEEKMKPEVPKQRQEDQQEPVRAMFEQEVTVRMPLPPESQKPYTWDQVPQQMPSPSSYGQRWPMPPPMPVSQPQAPQYQYQSHHPDFPQDAWQQQTMMQSTIPVPQVWQTQEDLYRREVFIQSHPRGGYSVETPEAKTFDSGDNTADVQHSSVQAEFVLLDPRSGSVRRTCSLHGVVQGASAPSGTTETEPVVHLDIKEDSSQKESLQVGFSTLPPSHDNAFHSQTQTSTVSQMTRATQSVDASNAPKGSHAARPTQMTIIAESSSAGSLTQASWPRRGLQTSAGRDGSKRPQQQPAWETTLVRDAGMQCEGDALPHPLTVSRKMDVACDNYQRSTRPADQTETQYAEGHSTQYDGGFAFIHDTEQTRPVVASSAMPKMVNISVGDPQGPPLHPACRSQSQLAVDRTGTDITVQGSVLERQTGLERGLGHTAMQDLAMQTGISCHQDRPRSAIFPSLLNITMQAANILERLDRLERRSPSPTMIPPPPQVTIPGRFGRPETPEQRPTSPTFLMGVVRQEGSPQPCTAISSKKDAWQQQYATRGGCQISVSMGTQTKNAALQIHADGDTRGQVRSPLPPISTMSPSPSFEPGLLRDVLPKTTPTRDAALQTDVGLAPYPSIFGHTPPAEPWALPVHTPWRSGPVPGHYAQPPTEGFYGDSIPEPDRYPSPGPWSQPPGGPWQMPSYTAGGRASPEIYPCCHLVQMVQTGQDRLSPPPRSPLPYSPSSCMVNKWQEERVVEQRIELIGEIFRGPTEGSPGVSPGTSGQESAGVNTESYCEEHMGGALVMGSGSMELDSGSQDLGSSGDGGGGAFIAGGGIFNPDAVEDTKRRSSIETTSNVSRSTKVVAILPEVTVICFLLALMLVLVASAILLSWTVQRHERPVPPAGDDKGSGGGNGPGTVHGASNTSIPAFEKPPTDTHLQTFDPSLHVTRGSPSMTSTYPGLTDIELCTTEFCVKEGQMLRYLSSQWHDSRTRACSDFYEFVCGPWAEQQRPDATYQDADGALSADIEAHVRDFLNGQESRDLEPLFRFWKGCLDLDLVPLTRVLDLARNLGLDLQRSMASRSKERLLGLAVTLVQEFGLCSLLTVELDRDPEGTAAYIIAVGEPELPLGKLRPPALWNRGKTRRMLTKVGAGLAALLDPGVEKTEEVSVGFSNVTMVLTSASMAHLHLSEQMAEYEVRRYEDLQFLHPLLTGLYGSTQAVGFGTRVLVKNPKFLRKLEKLLEHNRIQLHQYMVVLALLHLSPFLRVVEPVGLFLSSMTGLPISPNLPNRETLCLHLAERTLPNLLQMAYERIFKNSNLFDEVMGDVMVEEVRNALLEHIQSLNLMDAWTKIIAKIKTKNVKVYSFYPVTLAQPGTLADYVAKLMKSVPWEFDVVDYYIRLRGFLAQMMERDDSLQLFLPRWKHSVFDPECLYNPRRDVVYVPVGFFNTSVPTNPRERMFHVPRSAPRLVGCFLRVLLENINFYEPEGAWWTEKTRALVEERTSCLQRSHEALADAKHPQRRTYDPPYLRGLNDLEDTLSVRVALKVYDDLLYTNRYLDRDYRLVGAEHISSKQLFFIYYARSMCEVPDTFDRFMNSHLSSKSNGIYRVNVALMNNHEFADAFGCAAGTKMVPAEPCSVWECYSGSCEENRLA